jgi:hypothetical protein
MGETPTRLRSVIPLIVIGSKRWGMFFSFEFNYSLPIGQSIFGTLKKLF